MCSFRKLLLILTLIIILPVWVNAQAGNSDSEAAEAPVASATEEGFTVSIDLRLSGSAVGIVPGLSAVVGVPMSLSSDTVSLVPLVGFLYFFDVWNEIHSSYYVPVGIEVVYNPLNLGLELMYYPPVGVTEGIHLLSATAGAEVPLLEAGGFSINFGFGLGPMFVLDPVSGRVIFRINSALLMRYRI